MIGERQATSWRLAAKTEGAFHQQAGPHPGHRYCPAPAAGERLCVPWLQRNIGGLLAIAGFEGKPDACYAAGAQSIVSCAQQYRAVGNWQGGRIGRLGICDKASNQHPKKHGDREVEGCAFLSRLTVWQDCESGVQSVTVFVPKLILEQQPN